MAFFTPDFTQFFIDLAPNNNKEWFDENRKRYESVIKKPFQDFVQHIINKIAASDKRFEGLEPKHCIFRINRDIRFSKDKTPYKMNVSAVVAPEGKKSKAVNGIYFEFGPEHVRVYGGVYEIDKADLYTVREAIANNPSGFKKVYTDPKFVETFGQVLGDENKIIPKEFREAATIEPLIFKKQWYYYSQMDPEVLLLDNLDELILNCYEAGKPMEAYFNKLIKR
jgi:uncharacterized protein (TIGR02453 family)